MPPTTGGNLEEDDSLDGPDPLGAFNLTVPTPRLLADSSLNFTSAAVGDGVGACGLLTNGSIVCFCGYADVALEQPLPAKPRLMFGGAGGLRALDARGGTVCGITEAGGINCTGELAEGGRMGWGVGLRRFHWRQGELRVLPLCLQVGCALHYSCPPATTRSEPQV